MQQTFFVPTRRQIEEALKEAAAAARGLDPLALDDSLGLAPRFDSPEAESIVARAEDTLGTGALLEVCDLPRGTPADLRTLTDLFQAKLAARGARAA